MEGIITDLLFGNSSRVVNDIPFKNNLAYVPKSPKDIIYGQVLLNPAIVDFGQITFDQSRSVSLWNATTETQYLTDIIQSGFDGITIDGSTTGTFNPLQEETYLVNASVEGGNSINASATFEFTGLDNPVLNIFGTRILIFDFLPNYGNQNVLNYSFRTEIQTFYDGSEERHPVYVNSEMMMSNNYLVNEAEARKMKNILQNFGTNNFVAPIYQLKADIVEDALIDDTIIKLNSVLDFEIGMTIKIDKGNNSGQSVIKTIDEVNKTIELESGLKNNYKAGTMVFPILEVNFQENGNSITKVTGNAYECSFAFSVINLKENLKVYNDININTFDGLYILDAPPNVRDVNFSFDFIFEDFKDFGKKERITQMDKADNVFQYQFISELDEINYLKKFFYLNTGRLKEFLVPSYFQDYKLVENISSGNFTINVENNEDVSMNPNSDKREYIRLKLKDGQILYRKILGKQLNLDRTVGLTLNESFSQNINIDDVISIEFCYKCRFATDTLSISYYDYTKAEISLSFKTM